MIGLPVKMKGNLKCASSNFWSLLGTQNKDIGAALQTTLTEVKLRLQHRLEVIRQFWLFDKSLRQLHWESFTPHCPPTGR